MSAYSRGKVTKSLDRFLSMVKSIPNPRVLELGTLRQHVNCTMHHEFVPHASVFHGTDIRNGQDVDIVADVHKLTEVIKPESYDVIISCSTFEHFKYPNLAAHEIMKVLTIGGTLFIQTHHCFPLHAYPYDYYRFSAEALESCFGTKNGFSVISTDYSFECQITSDRINDSYDFLNTNLYGMKLSPTPEAFVYELDTDL